MRLHRLGVPTGPAYEVLFHPKAEKELFGLPDDAQRRFGRAIDQLTVDPHTSRAGVNVKKIADLGGGATLHRLRVGERRSCYAVTDSMRRVWILLFEDREVGYPRMVRRAQERFKGRP